MIGTQGAQLGRSGLCTVAVLSCCGAVTLVNTLFSGCASCRSLSGRVKVEFKASVVHVNKLRLYKHGLLISEFQ